MPKTPIFEALVETVSTLRMPLHVPGHKQGRWLPSYFAEWLGQAAKLDLTELPNLDNLHAPSGCIRASQALTAEWYGSRGSFFSVNGSSAGVIAAILTAGRDGKVLFANPFHQSAWRGVVLAGAQLSMAPVQFDRASCCHIPPTAAEVAEFIQKHPDATAVFVTSPTYHGLVADIRGIAEVCHAAEIPLIVDEAHGAHFGLIEELPKHSVACGADIVVQSVHKMLPGLTQTAWVHVQGNRISLEQFEDALLSLQTTSPSYLLLASLDVAQAWLREEGPAVAKQTWTTLAEEGILQGSGSQAMPFAVDPFRHWIPTGNAEVSQRINAELLRHGIYPEFVDGLGVLSMLGPGITREQVRTYKSVLEPLGSYELQTDNEMLTAASSIYEQTSTREWALKPNEVARRTTEWVTLSEAEGRVAARMITPYPPGIPVILPGQRLGRQEVQAIDLLLQLHSDVHGVIEGRIAVAVGI